VRTSSLEVRAIASLHALPRVGFIVPKHRHSAVERNPLKRRLRELLRLEVLPMLQTLPVPLDIVVRVSPQGYTRTYAQLAGELLDAGRRLARMTFVTTAVAASAGSTVVAPSATPALPAATAPDPDDVR
jgi:ribonuclease P protein component